MKIYFEKDLQNALDDGYKARDAEIVRCKDCKHYVIAQLKRDYTFDKRYSPSVCINGRYAVPKKPDWFCADGERKDDE